MTDLITYCTDSTALALEVAEKYPEKLTENEDGSYNFNITKIPTVRKDNLTLCLVRCATTEDENMLRSLTALEVLGTYDEVFASPLLDAKYKSVYPYDVPIEYTDENNTIQSYSRPKKIGGFA